MGAGAAMSNNNNSSAMPMPPGLLPVGNMAGLNINPDKSAAALSGIPKPSSSVFGNSAGVKALQSQYDPLSWEDFFTERVMVEDTVPVYTVGTKGQIIFCIHGAGHSAMTFARITDFMKDKYTVVAYDQRGHGDHKREDETVMDAETLIADTLKMLEFTMAKFPNRSILILGHSMGGSIAIKTMERVEAMDDCPLKKAVKAIFIVDVVEGTAMEALPFMEQIVKNRPPKFPDLRSVIKYGIQSGQVKDKKSARVSMPAQVVKANDKVTGLEMYVWRTDLLATKQYWEQWFKDLTKTFLNVKAKKMLFLAGIERMDTDLTRAQMMGQFQSCVIGDTGHVIQEDQPKALFNAIDTFVERNKIPEMLNQTVKITTLSGKIIEVMQ